MAQVKLTQYFTKKRRTGLEDDISTTKSTKRRKLVDVGVEIKSKQRKHVNLEDDATLTLVKTNPKIIELATNEGKKQLKNFAEEEAAAQIAEKKKPTKINVEIVDSSALAAETIQDVEMLEKSSNLEIRDKIDDASFVEDSTLVKSIHGGLSSVKLSSKRNVDFNDKAVLEKGSVNDGIRKKLLNLRTAKSQKDLGEESETIFDQLNPKPVADKKIIGNDEKALAKIAQLKEKLAAINKQKIKLLSDKESVPGCCQPKAYERSHHLAVSDLSVLPLPYKYKVLEEMFKSTDVVISMLYNRKETCTFSKLKKGVQQMLRKNFELKHLAQIKAVYGDAYAFDQERLTQFGGSGKYQLTITPSFKSQSKETSSNKDDRLSLSSSLLFARTKLFHTKLINIVKDHHKNYLLSLNPPIEIESSDVKRWHLDFKLNDVPDIVPATLPSSPDEHRLTTASEMLAKANGTFDKRIQSALAVVTEKFSSSAPSIQESNVSTSESPSRAPKGAKLLQDIFAKVRAKEAALKQREMMRDPETDRKLTLVSRLPEFARILRNFYITEKKSAILMENVAAKLVRSSSSGVSLDNIEEHLQLLKQLVPNWIMILNVSRGCYVKINKNDDINKVIEIIHQEQNRLKNS